METRPLTPHLGVELVGVDLREVTPDCALEIATLLLRHGIVLVRDQRMDTQDHVRFSHHFGELERFPGPGGNQEEVLFRLSSDGTQGYKGVGLYWHTDGYFHAQPTAASILRAVSVPPRGGDTCFANMARAYSVLPPEMRTWLDRLVGISRPAPGARRSAGLFGRSSVTGVRHPIVRPHPLTGTRVLYLNVANMAGIEGMPADQAKGLIEQLANHVDTGDFVYRHCWRDGDVILWDNAGVAHKATVPPAGTLRLMERTTVEGKEFFGSEFWSAAAGGTAVSRR